MPGNRSLIVKLPKAMFNFVCGLPWVALWTFLRSRPSEVVVAYRRLKPVVVESVKKEYGELKQDLTLDLDAEPQTSRKRPYRLRATHLIIVSLFGFLLLLVLYNTAPEGDAVFRKRALSGVYVFAFAFSVLIFLWFIGVIHALIEGNPEENRLPILLSPEVVAIVIGTIISLAAGSFAVNHMLEKTERDKHLQQVALAEYDRQIDILQRFTNDGQKILFYAYMYRAAEEWWVANKEINTHRLKNSSDVRLSAIDPDPMVYLPPPFPLAFDDAVRNPWNEDPSSLLGLLTAAYQETAGQDIRDAMAQAYHDYLTRYVESGSIESICAAVETHYISNVETEADETPPLPELLERFERKFTVLIESRNLYPADAGAEATSAMYKKNLEELGQRYNVLCVDYQLILKAMHTHSVQFFNDAYRYESTPDVKPATMPMSKPETEL